MKYVYNLIHSHVSCKLNGEDLYDTKDIGYYSSLQKAQDTMERYQSITGFKDYPNGFKIEKIEIDCDNFDFI